MFPIIIERTDFELVIVGPIDESNNGLILRTHRVEQDLLGFAHLIYNYPNTELTMRVLDSISNAYKQNENTIYDYMWNTLDDEESLKIKHRSVRGHKLLFAWKAKPRFVDEYKNSFSNLIKKSINSSLSEIRYSLDFAKINFEDDEMSKDSIIQDLKNKMEWHISTVLLLGGAID